MKSITVFVMLDACRHDYINERHTPFLNGLLSTGFSCPVRPTFGFEPDAAYLAGLWPDEADGGAQFWYAPEQSPFKPAGFLSPFADRLPNFPQKVFRKMLVTAARYRCSSPNLSTARIPFRLLKNFALPVEFGLDHPQFCPNHKTLFDLLRVENKKWLFHAAPGHRVSLTAACKRAERELKVPKAFAFFHVGNLDGVGHAHGPDATEISGELLQVDKGMERIYNLAADRFDIVHFVVMGDHGMIRVEQTIDLASVLTSLPLSQGKDYLYFLDSTMARFWFFSDGAKEEVTNELAVVKGGRILEQKDKDKYHLNYSHNRFGDLVFLADPGVLIIPNHYQDRSPVKGMHGYGPEVPGQQAVLIVNSIKAGRHAGRDPVDMRRVFPTLCDLLEIKKPPGLKSLITPSVEVNIQ